MRDDPHAPAFPAAPDVFDDRIGLSKREYAAIQICAGMMGGDALLVAISKVTGQPQEITAAQFAVLQADALLAELAKEQK